MPSAIKKISLPFIIITIVLISFFSCGLFQEQGGTAQVRINLGTDSADSSLRGVLPPAGINIASYTVKVTGPGMDPINQTVPSNVPVISILVPAGKERRFVIEAQLAPGSLAVPGYVRSFIGRREADQDAGSLTLLTFQMVAGKTDLIVPDYMNNQLLQTADIGFASPHSSGFGIGVTLAPIDVDVSAQGTLFVARRGAGNGIAYGNDIDGTDMALIDAANVTALAVDRVNNILYFSTYNEATYTASLQMCPLPYNPLVPPTALDDSIVVVLEGEQAEYYFSVSGMDVDPWSGMLYLTAYTRDAGGVPVVPLVIQYDPTVLVPGKTNPGRAVRYALHPDFRVITDVVAKDDAVYVANSPLPNADNVDLSPLLKFNKNLTFSTGYGRFSGTYTGTWQVTASVTAGDFYGAKRFVAKGNTELTVIDDSAAYDKLISLNQGLGDDSWQTFPVSEADTPPFGFFE